MGVGVNARTAFSLLFPPILDEFVWERGVTAGAFSFGFLVSAVLSPSLGRLMDRRGPRVVIEMGVGLMAAGLMLATLVRQPWHLYATLGVLVGGGGVCLGYTGQALFLPNWFVRRRGLAMSLAFSGVGVGSIILLPWLGTLIGRTGWRAACWAMGILVLALLAPLNLLLKRRPEDLGLEPDGDRSSRDATAGSRTPKLLYLMVASQGMLGYGLTSVIGAIPAEIFQGRHYGTIFGTLMLASIAGGAAGPWVTGVLHDATGSYTLAFWIAIGCSVLSALAIWLAAPREVRAVAGRAHRRP